MEAIFLLGVGFTRDTTTAIVCLTLAVGFSGFAISGTYLTVKAPKNCSRRHFNFLRFYFYLPKKIRLDVSSESSAKQRIHLKHQVLFFLKNNEKIFMNAVCCSRDWLFKG